jgi:hypothetical protein
MQKIAASLGALAAVLSTMAIPTAVSLTPAVAQAQSYEHRVERRRGYARRSYYARDCRRERRSSGNKGTVAGALVGGASGALIGGDVLGGLVGAGVGAVAGHQIAKSRVKC